MYELIGRARPACFGHRALFLGFGHRHRSSPIAAQVDKSAYVARFSAFRAAYASSTGPTSTSSKAFVIFASDQPAELPNRLSSLSAWSLSPSKMGITRQFTFPTFAAAWRFMSQVADECKTKRHHPTWSNTYNQVIIEWTTHRPKGLSIKDVEMAEFCDRTADAIGLKPQGQNSSPTSVE